ncbi:MAG: hypothetical protein A2252_10795 [Elusimicrobia bacterium RIFOXYA2_FULL_39_19]|nr:MAG: hypothetical protein A2252_10795 [Elusimicrobia bacterium RIFOXYA2_FULL_39_19]
MNRDLEFFFLDGVETQSVDISQALANKGIDPEVEPYYMDVFVRAEATGMMGTGNATFSGLMFDAYAKSDKIAGINVSGVTGQKGGFIAVDKTSLSVKEYDTANQLVKEIGAGVLTNPEDTAKDSLGNYYVSDAGDNTIKVFDKNGNYLSAKTISGFSSIGKIACLAGTGVASDKLYCIDGNSIKVFNLQTNGLINTIGAGLNNPKGLTVDTDGNVYIADTGNNRMIVYDTNNTEKLVITDNLNMPLAVDVDDYGNIYIADTGNNKLKKYKSTGEYEYALGGIDFSNPVDIQLNKEDNRTVYGLSKSPRPAMYVADKNNNRAVVLYDFVKPYFCLPPAVKLILNSEQLTVNSEENETYFITPENIQYDLQTGKKSLVINGTAKSYGLVANVGTDSWVLSCGEGKNPAQWTEIASGTQNKENETLANWDITDVLASQQFAIAGGGIYTLKLTLSYQAKILNIPSIKTEEHKITIILPDWSNIADSFENSSEDYFWLSEYPDFMPDLWTAVKSNPAAGGSFAKVTDASVSPVTSYKATIPQGGYAYYLISPTLDLRGKTKAGLKFKTKYNLPGNPANPYFRESAYVEISKDNGGTWERVYPVNSYPDNAYSLYSDMKLQGYAGTNDTWTQEIFSLDKYAGTLIKMRFTTDRDASSAGEGNWWIDDVEIGSDIAVNPVDYTGTAVSEITEDFLPGKTNWIKGSSVWENWQLNGSEYNSVPYSISIDNNYQRNQYKTNQKEYLYSPKIDLTNTSHAVLSFSQKYNFETDKDGGKVEISIDNGQNWQLLTPNGGYSCALVDALGTAGFGGTNTTWSKINFNLDSFTGNTAILRLCFATDGQNIPENGGWWIDDVYVITRNSFVDNVEGSEAMLWQKETAPGKLGQWEITEEQNVTPTHSWKAGIPDGNYDTQYPDCWIKSPLIDLTNTQSPELRFKHKYSFAQNYPGYVYGKAEISVDNGSNWSQINQGYYEGNSGGSWIDANLDLSAYTGNVVRVRFHSIRRGSEWANGSYWYLDDISIGEIDTTAPVTSLILGIPSHVDGENNKYIDSVTELSLQAVDEASGVNSTQYQINGGEWKNYSVPFKLTDEVDSTPPSGIIGYWDFEEGAGDTAVDTSGNGNNGTIYGATRVHGPEGTDSNALSFNGINNYVSIPNSASLNVADNITIEFWFNPADIPSYAKYPLSKGTNTGNLSYIFYWIGHPAWLPQKLLILGNTDGIWGRALAPESSVIPLNEWTHLAWTYSSTVGGKLFINGEKVGETAPIGQLTINTNPIEIARAWGNEYFKGAIDNLAIYNRALTEPDVLNRYYQVLNKIPEGNHTVSFYSTDNKANTENPPKTETVIVDNTPPETKLYFTGTWFILDPPVDISTETYTTDTSTYTPTPEPEPDPVENTTISSRDNPEPHRFGNPGVPGKIDITYVRPDTVFLFQQTDTYSGVLETKYRVDDNLTWEIYGSGFTLGDIAEGEHEIHFYSVDNLNHTETVKKQPEDINLLVLDKSPPVLSAIEFGVPYYRNSQTGTDYITSDSPVKLTASDGDGSGVLEIKWMLDNSGTWNTYSGDELTVYMRDYSVLDGVHQIKYYATDNLNYGDELNALTFDFMVDNTLPVTQITVGLPNYELENKIYMNETTEITLTGSDSGATASELKRTEWKINGGKWVNYLHPFTLVEYGTEPALPVGCVGHWKFNEESGDTAVDISGNGNDAVIYGATRIVGSDLLTGTALYFDGIDDYVSIPNNSSLNITENITIEFWFNPADIPSYAKYPLSKGTNTSNMSYIFYWLGPASGVANQKKLWVTGKAESGWGSNLGPVTPEIMINEWTHVAWTYSSSDGGKIYLNGEKVSEGPSFGTLASNTNPIEIARAWIPNEYFKGSIDDLAIYNRVLTPEEITTRSEGTATVELTEGEHELCFRSIDNSDNIEDYEPIKKLIVFDKTAPEITNISIMPDKTSVNPVTITFKTSENLKENPQITVNGNQSVFGSFDSNTLTYSYIYSVTAGDQQGEAVVRIEAQDYVSHITVNETGRFIIDTIAPVVSLNSPVPKIFNPAAGEKTTIPIEINEVSQVTIEIYNAANLSLIETLGPFENQQAGVHPYVWSGLTGVSGEEYYFVVKVKDSLNNLTTVDSRDNSFTMEIQSNPTISLLSGENTFDSPDPIDPQASETIQFSYQLYANAGWNLEVTIGIYDSLEVLKTQLGPIIQMSGINSIVWDGKDGTTPLDYGTYKYRIEAREAKVNGSTVYSGRSANAREGTLTLYSNTAPAPKKSEDEKVAVLSEQPVTIIDNPVIPQDAQIALILAGQQGQYLVSGIYDLGPVGTTFPANAPAILSFSYDPTFYGDQIALYTYNPETMLWEMVENQYVDAGNNQIIAQLTHVSLYAVFKIRDTAKPEIVNLSANPVVFSPNNDSKKDMTVINYTLKDNISRPIPQLKLNIYNQQNELVRTIVNNNRRLLGENSEIWNGKNDFSSIVIDGIYAYKIKAIDQFGNISEDATGEVTVDNTAPVVQLLAPIGSEKFIATVNKINVNFNVTDNLDPNPEVSAYLYNQTSGEKLIVCKGNEIEPLSISAGIWKLTVEAVDWAENTTSSTTASFEVIHDVKPPRSQWQVVSGKWLVKDEKNYISSQTQIELTAVDDLIESGDGVGLGVEAIKFTVDGLPFTDYIEPLTLTTEGVHTIEYQAIDVIGNTETLQSIVVYVDNTAPESKLELIGMKYESFGNTIISPNTQIELTATDPVVEEVASGVKEIKYSIGGSPFTAYNLPFTISTEGIHTIEYYSSDNLDNTEGKNVFTVTVTVLPVYALLGTEGININGNVKVIGSLRSNNQIEINGNPGITGDIYCETIAIKGNPLVTGATYQNVGPIITNPVDLTPIVDSVSQFNNNNTIPLLNNNKSAVDKKGVLVLKSKEVLALTTGLYYLNGMELSAESKLEITGKVEILCTGKIVLSANAQLNYNNNPYNLTIYVSSWGINIWEEDNKKSKTKEEKTEIKLSGNALINALVYAPYSEARLSGESGFTGSIFCKNADITGNARVYDSVKEEVVEVAENTTQEDTKGNKKALSIKVLDATFRLRDIYAYPNPAKNGANSIIHIECGIADNVEIKIYNIAGEKIAQQQIDASNPQIINNTYCYEYTLNANTVASGVYIYYILAEKSGEQPIKVIKKLAVIQ